MSLKAQGLTQKKSLSEKYRELQAVMRSYKRVVIGFSGGVDSTLLAKVAFDELCDGALAVIGRSASYPGREEEQAVSLAKSIGIAYQVLDTGEMAVGEYLENKGDRCYYCKKELYRLLSKVKEESNFNEVLDGTNLSDLGDHRPGLKATEELGIRKPLLEIGFTKEDVRALARELSLSNWDKPEFACLSSRIPVGLSISTEALSRVEQGEQKLYDLGFRQFRLRYHGNIARIQLLDKDFQQIIDPAVRSALIHSLTELGFDHVTLDLLSYQRGNKPVQAGQMPSDKDI